jgi:aspartate racemase
MKKIGILGGLAWPATVEYYRVICRLSQDYHAPFSLPGPSPMPEMCIESVNINYSYNRRGIFGDDDSWKEYDAYFRSALLRLEKNGVDFAIIAGNTPHTRFDSITRGLTIPVLSIYETVADVCRDMKIKELLILGTEPTMNSGAFSKYFQARGITAFAPPDKEAQSKVVAMISELLTGTCENGSVRLGRIVTAIHDRHDLGDTTVCLACTEHPLAFPGKKNLETFEDTGIVYLNTTMIHAAAAFKYAVGD